MKKYLPIIILLAVSLTTHFALFGYPNKTVFDEVHFGKFISGYFTHEYFFDIHPPLGKLLISGAGYLTGFEPGFSFSQIGDQFPDSKYLWLRFLPTLAGTLLAVVVYLLGLKLGLSRLASFVAGLFIAFENSLIVQSRFILLDAFLLLFGFMALMLYFSWKKNNNKYCLILAGLFAGMSVAVKWTGLSFLGLIIMLELAQLWFNKDKFFSRKTLSLILSLVIIPIVIYSSTFLIHLRLLYKSGTGDAFMTPEFRKTLIGTSEYKDDTTKPIGMAGKIIQLNKEMYRANAGLTATHPYSSNWYTWPFMQRPIYYWNQSTINPDKTVAGEESKIYFMGNPFIWWLSTLAIVYILTDTISDLINKKKPRKILLILSIAFILNILPFIGIKRAMFLYHYMPAYVFAILALAYILDQTKSKQDKFGRWKKEIISGALFLVAILFFLFFSPITYGLSQPVREYNIRVWFDSWR